MPDKEAIISISSNLTIFKEMTVAKAKGQDLQKTVKLQMQAELNLDDTYSVSYIVVGDVAALMRSLTATEKCSSSSVSHSSQLWSAVTVLQRFFWLTPRSSQRCRSLQFRSTTTSFRSTSMSRVSFRSHVLLRSIRLTTAIPPTMFSRQ